MKYVAKHLTRHHFFHAPHRWFFALLLSPIHAAELHYQKHYHLQFAHARKLFLFDLSLVAAIFGLAGLTLYWFWYDPTITEKIALNVRANNENNNDEAGRIRSGEKITFAINFTNTSDQELNATELRVRLPQHFIMQNTAGAIFNTSTQTFAIGRVLRNTNQTVYATGIFYGIPNTDEHVVAELHYTPSLRAQPESKLAALITNLRDSVLQATVELPARLPARSNTKTTLTLLNTYNYDLPEIFVPFATGTISWSNARSVIGVISNDGWRVPGLKPNEQAMLDFTLNTNISGQINTATLRITPYIFPNNISIAQQTVEKNWSVARPEININSAWENQNAAAGSVQKLIVTLYNHGTESIQNLTLTIPFSANVDAVRWGAVNNGRVTNGAATLTRAHDVRLTQLDPGQEVAFTFSVPIKSFPTGAANAKLSLPIRLHAQIAGITSEFDTEALTSDLSTGTALRVSGEARYYTADGDQLGRGPLPPQVGKQTKYAILLRAANSVGDAENVRLTATLPNGIEWTGKTSVSRGQEITYDAGTRRLTWSARTFPALAELSTFIEVGFTPTETQHGQTVPLLQNITIEGTDTTLNQPVRATAPTLTSALSADSLAQNASTAVR